MQLTINAYTFISAMQAALLFAAKKDVRYYLNGVHLQRLTDGKAYVQATDGHKLLRMTVDCEATDGLDAILPREFCEQISKLKVARPKRDEAQLVLAISGQAVSISCQGVTLSAELVDGRFPDVDRVIPSLDRPAPKDALPVGLNADYLARVGKAGAILGHPKSHGLRMSPGGPNEAVRFDIPTNHGEFLHMIDDAVAVVMPVRL